MSTYISYQKKYKLKTQCANNAHVPHLLARMLKYKNSYNLLAKGQVAISPLENCLYWSCVAGDIQTPRLFSFTFGIIPLNVLQYITFSVSLLFGWYHGHL